MFLFLLVLFLSAIIYLDVRGFPPFLKQIVEDQLARQGWPTRFSSIRLDVFRGIIARDAVLANMRVRDQVLARIDELQIEWNWRRLLNAQNAIDALRIANATISVPTPADEIGGEVFQASEAHARFRFEDDGAIQIDELTGVYAGIRVRISGRLRPSRADATTKKTEPAQKQFVFVTKALRELNGLQGEQPPQLDVDFDFDLGAALDSRVNAKLYAAAVNYRKLNVEKLTAAVRMQDGAVDIQDVTLAVGKGELTLHGRYDIAAGNFDLKLDSSLDPNLFLPSLPEQVTSVARDFHVFEPPKISIRYLLSPETGTEPVLQGRVEFGALECRSVPFQRIAFTFENKGAQLRLDDVKIVMKEGQLTGHGHMNIETSDFTYELDSTLDPRKLLPLMPPVIRQIVEPSWFETPPHVVAQVQGDFVDPDAFGYDATVTTKRCAYRGVTINSAAGKIKVRQSMLDAQNIVVKRDEGEVRGWIFANFNTQRIAFDLSCTANPSALVPILGPLAADTLRPYRFGPRTVAAGRGLIDILQPLNTVLHATGSNDGFGWWKLTADKASADLTITNGVLTIDNGKAELYGGHLQCRATATLSNDAPYMFDFGYEHIDIQKLLRAIGGKERQVSGYMNGATLIKGHGTNDAAMTGGGKLSIEDGVLLELPLFGIFSRILNDISAGAGTTKATKAEASFIFENAAARTDDMVVEAGAFTMTGRGKVGFDGKLDFRIKGQLLRSIPGLNFLTWLLSNAFEYKIGGTLNDPSYRPTNFPKEVMPHEDSSKPKDAH